MMKRYFKILICLIILSFSSGCVLTKAVTVPMRVGGAAASIVPVVGNPAHDTVDKAAEEVDKLPI